MINLKEKTKQFVNFLLDVKYHYVHKKEALNLLKRLEKTHGCLSKELKKECDEYALNTLGHRKFAPWLYVYACIQKKFCFGWIPDNYYGRIVIPSVSGKFSDLSSIKNLSSILLNTDLFPDLLHFTNGNFFEPKTNRLIPIGNVKKFIFEDQNEIIFKCNSSARGLGIKIFNKENFSIDDIIKMGSGVFQRIIKQHNVFTELFPERGATIRVTTAYDYEKHYSSVRGAVLRLGTGTDKYLKASSLVRVAINLETGKLHDDGYLPDWTVVKTHPTTNKPFNGVKIPNFNRLCSTITEIHDSFPYTQCIGWDAIINDKGDIELMEWNCKHNDIKFTESIQGASFTGLGWENIFKNQKKTSIKN